MTVVTAPLTTAFVAEEVPAELVGRLPVSRGGRLVAPPGEERLGSSSGSTVPPCCGPSLPHSEEDSWLESPLDKFEAFLAFGNASIAVIEVTKLARRRTRGDTARDLLGEVSLVHDQLRALFADGLDDAVCVRARDVMELPSRTADVLEQEQ